MHSFGMKLAEKYKEKPEICNAIGAHHDEIEQQSLLAPIVQVCDAISGARPGARREIVEAYIKRLNDLEQLALSYPGVIKTYAIQAGRELRVIVGADKIDDAETEKLSAEIAKRIQTEMTYPGQVKITVIRETRSVSFAKVMNTDNENIPATPREIPSRLMSQIATESLRLRQRSNLRLQPKRCIRCLHIHRHRADATLAGKRREEKLHCHNWLDDIPGGYADFDIVEVQFKNTRKGYYRNTTGLDIAKGDLVAVEASPGHDIGEITLTGRLVALQMKKAGLKRDAEIKRIFRKAKPSDIEKYEEAKARENDTMIKARKIAEDLNLNMKIGDVEYQGDGNKAIFLLYCRRTCRFPQTHQGSSRDIQSTHRDETDRSTSGSRPHRWNRPMRTSPVLFHLDDQLRKRSYKRRPIPGHLAQPQKLAGQCAKLKCCLNFEVDAYVESVRQMPSKDIRLETADNTYFHFKTDIFKREITYSTDKQMAANLVTIPAKRAFEVIALNKSRRKAVVSDSGRL